MEDRLLQRHDVALESLDGALWTFTRALDIYHGEIARVHSRIAAAKRGSGDVAGAVESLRESVRI